MANKKGVPTPEGPSNADILAALQEAQRQNEQYREMVEQQAAANAAMKSRLSAYNPSQNPYAELMVGIRNVSDNTLGIAEMNGNAEFQLMADFGNGEPGSCQIIPYAQWRELRKGKFVRNGMIVRDDSIIGPGTPVAPDDRPEDLPAEAKHNAILDPKDWIESRSESEIHAGLAQITNEESLQRIRRAVDDELRKLEATQPRGTKEQQIKAAKLALARLPGKYRMVDELITTRLEAPEDGEDWDAAIWVTPTGRGWTRKGQ